MCRGTIDGSPRLGRGGRSKSRRRGSRTSAIGCADGRSHHDFDTAVGEHPFEAAPGEEADMAAVEEAALVVVEAPECDASSRVPMSEVGDARERSGPEV